MTPTDTTPHASTTYTPDQASWWWRACGTDRDRINLAYLYDAFREARNSDNYPVPCIKFAHHNEYAAARRLTARIPNAGFVFRSERAFLDRAATYLVARQNVSAIVVAGAGLPHIDDQDDLHSIIRRSEVSTHNRRQNSARAAVIYVERDPLTLAHLRTVADVDNGVHAVQGEPWDPTAMWNKLYNTASENPGLVSAKHDRVALLLGPMLSYHGGSRTDVAQLVQAHLARLPAGAFLALTHLFLPDHPDLAAQALEFEDALQFHGPGTGSLATHEQIEAMIAGTALLPPGIGPAFAWYPDGPPTDPPVCGNFAAAVLAQKPGSDSSLPEPPWRPDRT
ncbi:SAM-dependent methyltransferase [Amycolatopsis sp. NPDC004169]|uniref:SAM-dependent methyltransferase n=1 Tax=Amycolatopsis sp. NPDC004169 TaxID=3154453 RepID=UPI00339F6CE7